MIVIAVLLLLVVVAVVVFVLMTGADQEVTLSSDLLNLDWQPSALVVFLLGALCLLLAGLALALIQAGARRKVERRRELKRLREADKARAAGDGTDVGRERADDGRNVVDVREGERDHRGSTRTMPVAPDDGLTPNRPEHEVRLQDDEARSGASRATWHDDPDGRPRS